MMLLSPLPTSIWYVSPPYAQRDSSRVFRWGYPHHILIYNSAYVTIIGADKHPGALGQPAQAVWPEVWDLVSAPMRVALLHGKMSHFENDMVLIPRREADRALAWEEFYFTVGARAHTLTRIGS
jgi:hypothetical protein